MKKTVRCLLACLLSLYALVSRADQIIANDAAAYTIDTIGKNDTSGLQVYLDVSDEAEAGKPFILKAHASGGSGPLTYRFTIKKDGVWTVLREYSALSYVSWVPEKPGTYPVAVTVRDPDMKPVKSQAKINAVQYEPLVITMDDQFSPAAGYETVLKAKAEGGKAPYQYCFTRKTDGTWNVVQNWSSSYEYTFTPVAAGSYPVAVQVKDARGITQKYQSKLIVRDYSDLKAVLTAEGELKAGREVRFKAAASGGQGPYQYRFTMKEGSTWVVKQDWSSASELSCVFEEPGTYQCAVRIKDSAGNVQSDKISTVIDEAQPLSVQAEYSAEVYEDRGFAINLTASGGYGAYRFRMTRKNGDVWEEYQPYSAESQITVQEQEPGIYKYCVFVKDEQGKTDSKLIKVKVTEWNFSPDGCPVTIIPSIFVNQTAEDVIRFYGDAHCQWNVSYYDDIQTNPKNYMGVAAYERTSENTADLIMYVRW